MYSINDPSWHMTLIGRHTLKQSQLLIIVEIFRYGLSLFEEKLREFDDTPGKRNIFNKASEKTFFILCLSNFNLIPI